MHHHFFKMEKLRDNFQYNVLFWKVSQKNTREDSRHNLYH
jgi:hypothetical protein